MGRSWWDAVEEDKRRRARAANQNRALQRELKRIFLINLTCQVITLLAVIAYLVMFGQ